MSPANYVLVGAMTLAVLITAILLLLLVAYLLGWFFSAGYHNQKYQHTKRLVELLREGKPSQ
jgi:uncharacterized protein YggT (Ycf19 family)